MDKDHLLTGFATALGVLLAQVISTGGFRPGHLVGAVLAGAIAVLLLLAGKLTLRKLGRHRHRN